MNDMKKGLFCCLMISLLGSNIISAQSYEYPIKPGSEEWKTLPVAEKNKLLQIPESMLSTMTTEELIQAYVDNPFTTLIFAYNKSEDGLSRIYNEFNGLRELMRRKDAGQKLIEYYKNMDPGAYDVNWEPARRGQFTFTFVYIEVLLAQESILEQFSTSEVRSLLSELLKKHELMIEHVSEHSIVGLEMNAFSMAKLIESRGKDNRFSQMLLQTQGMEDFLRTAMLQNENILPAIIQIARELLQDM